MKATFVKCFAIVGGAMAWNAGMAAAPGMSPNTSFETMDGINAPTQGALVVGSGDGPGWQGPWQATYLPADTTYDGTEATTGSWSMLQDTTGRDEEPEIERIFARPMKKGHLAVRVRLDKVDRNSLGLFLSNGPPNLRDGNPAAHGGRAVYVAFIVNDHLNSTGGNGDMTAYSGQSEIVIADAAQAANVWYEIGIDFDCTKDTFDVYLE
jgi:hypothetical protein